MKLESIRNTAFILRCTPLYYFTIPRNVHFSHIICTLSTDICLYFHRLFAILCVLTSEIFSPFCPCHNNPFRLETFFFRFYHLALDDTRNTRKKLANLRCISVFPRVADVIYFVSFAIAHRSRPRASSILLDGDCI